MWCFDEKTGQIEDLPVWTLALMVLLVLVSTGCGALNDMAAARRITAEAASRNAGANLAKAESVLEEAKGMREVWIAVAEQMRGLDDILESAQVLLESVAGMMRLQGYIIIGLVIVLVAMGGVGLYLIKRQQDFNFQLLTALGAAAGTQRRLPVAQPKPTKIKTSSEMRVMARHDYGGGCSVTVLEPER